MIVSVIFFIILSKVCGIQGMDTNSLFGRRICYPNVQPNCNQSFIEVYPHLSKSATDLTVADTIWWLFTRRNPDTPECLHMCAGKLPPDTNFNPRNDLVVIVNPFAVGICDVEVYRQWMVQILIKGDYNVLLTDYRWGNHFDYGTAMINIRLVAKQTVIVLKNIQEQTGITKDQITLVGHSLGAQLCGLIGQDFPVRRITGLDPASPGYDAEKTPPEDRLDQSDADFVDVCHVNMGKCLPNLGTMYDVGHVNFYINGGYVQKACHEYAFRAILKRDYVYGIGTALSPSTCWHAFVAVYYKVSINPGNCQFLGVKCDSCSDFNLGKCSECGANGENCLIMGFDTDKYIKGNISSPEKYYLTTVDECPYCDNCDIDLQGYADTYRSSLQTPEENQSPNDCSKRMRCIGR